jgi:tetratricopeptide (TPR) repeat protein
MGVSEETVRSLCRDGVLSGVVQEWDNGPWRIPVTAVSAWKKQQAPAGQEEQAEVEALDAIPADEQQTAASGAELPATPFWQKMVAIGAIVAFLAGVAGFLADSLGVLDRVRPYLAKATPLPFNPESEDEILIVIASFYHSEGIPDTEAHHEIRRAIQEAASELGFSHLRVEVEPTRLAADDRAGAEKLGNRYNASIVIWGEDTGARVTANLLNLEEPDSFAASVRIREIERTQLADPSAYVEFITTDLPKQLVFFSLFAVGQSYYIDGAYDESIRAIEKAVSTLEPKHPKVATEVYFRLGWLYQKMGDDKEAIANYNRALDIDSTLAAIYNNRGVARYAQDDLVNALADYNRAIELDHDYVQAYSNRCAVYTKKGSLDNALADCAKAITLDPNYAEAYFNRGNAYKALGNLTSSIADYNQAIALNPHYAAAYNNRGNAYREQGNLDTAIEDYSQAIIIDPELAQAYNNRAFTRSLQGEFSAAIDDLDKAIELDPQLAQAYGNRGAVCRKLGNAEAALADLRRYLELRPNTDDREMVEEWIIELEAQISEPEPN